MAFSIKTQNFIALLRNNPRIGSLKIFLEKHFLNNISIFSRNHGNKYQEGYAWELIGPESFGAHQSWGAGGGGALCLPILRSRLGPSGRQTEA